MSSTKGDTDSSLDDSLTNIQWLCKLESKTLLDIQQTSSRQNIIAEPSSMNPYPKPPYSYATLILLAINSTLEKRMTLQDIYKWIEGNFPYYTKCKKAWKNSIRHNLSLHSFFLKAKRPTSLPGKGSYWSISPEGKENIMKEVMKYQQPVISQNMNLQQSGAKGLRPILPKPSNQVIPSPTSSVMGNNCSVQVLTDGSMPGLPGNNIPVVILPTQVYMTMANKLAAQATAGTLTGMTIGMGQSFVPMATSSTNVHLGTVGETLTGVEVKRESNEIEPTCTMVKERSGGVVSQCVVLLNDQHTKPGSDHLDNKHSEIVSNDFTDGTSSNETRLGRNLKKNDYTNNDEMLAPQTKKTKTDKRKTQSSVRKMTPSFHSKQPKRSPLRPRPQPTLAAINSRAIEAISPGSIFSGTVPHELGLVSPVKPIITPSKDCGNQNLLASLWVSPLGSSTLGYNSHSGFTPLNYGSDSGFFTPFKEGEMDYGFILSPERFSCNKVCSTPQSCRKSLRLGFSKGERRESDAQWTGDPDPEFARF